MPIVKMVPNAVHVSEFAPASWGERRNGTCTQCASAMALTSALGLSSHPQDVIDLMLHMRDAMFARGECAENGGATVYNMAKELRNRGASVLTEWDYQEPLQEDWHTLLKEHAGVHPIVLQVANAFHLYDASGTGEDAGVRYHAVAIMGISDTGYVIGDPNNPTVSQTFDIYPYAALLAAVPCGLIMLDVTHSAPSITAQPQGGSAMAIPAGWSDDGTTLTAPNGHHVVHGFRAWVLSHAWGADNVPLGDESHTDDVGADGMAGAGAQQVFAETILGWTEGRGVFVCWAGGMWLKAQGALAAAQQQAAALQAQVQALTAQLAQEQATPAPVAATDTRIVELKALLQSIMAS